jgi:hypothetical protein
LLRKLTAFTLVILDQGNAGMHIRRGSFRHVEPYGGRLGLVSHDRQHVIEWHQPTGGNGGLSGSRGFIPASFPAAGPLAFPPPRMSTSFDYD